MRFYIIVLVLCLAVFFVLPATKTASDSNNTPSNQCMSGCSCLAGHPGIPGLHGKPGAPGRDGRDGREGIQGKRGPPGFGGTPGRQGPHGSPGNTGKSGPSGPEGAKGDPGPKGDKREPGMRGLSSYSNWKECSWTNIEDDKDNGVIKVCNFNKNYSDSVLHVYWNGNLRITNCKNCCKRWFFTLNDAECKNPRPIDGIAYMGNGMDHNIHRVRHIEGHCDKINKGHVRVGFNIGNCAGYGNADAQTGWNSVSRLFVEEVSRPQL